jgi:two-component system, chemotaxis family, CheB/CheR fusion protein
LQREEIAININKKILSTFYPQIVTLLRMRKKDFFVVAIGTSSGGLNVLKNILRRLPEHNNAAFIIIQHLHPNFKSSTEELLAGYTKMQVYRACENEVVKTGCVYVLPENKTMTIRNGRLSLIARDREDIINRAITIFFESMGPDLKERAIGIVLTGDGTDGTAGSASIHDHGGVIMVQRPDTAEFESMPQSMVTHGLSNFTLPVDQLVDTLAELIRPKQKI